MKCNSFFIQIAFGNDTELYTYISHLHYGVDERKKSTNFNYNNFDFKPKWKKK